MLPLKRDCTTATQDLTFSADVFTVESDELRDSPVSLSLRTPLSCAAPSDSAAVFGATLAGAGYAGGGSIAAARGAGVSGLKRHRPVEGVSSAGRVGGGGGGGANVVGMWNLGANEGDKGSQEGGVAFSNTAPLAERMRPSCWEGCVLLCWCFWNWECAQTLDHTHRKIWRTRANTPISSPRCQVKSAPHTRLWNLFHSVYSCLTRTHVFIYIYR